MAFDLIATIQRREVWVSNQMLPESGGAAAAGLSQGLSRDKPESNIVSAAPVPRSSNLGSRAPGTTYVRFTLKVGELARQAEPGQFVMAKVPTGSVDPFLRRPFSLHRIDREREEVQILFQVKGRGTSLLAERDFGETLPVLGPLGRGFTLDPQRRRMILVGGGIGVAPLLALAEKGVAAGYQVLLLLGARSRGDLLALPEFEALGVKILVATDDGSRGHPGLVTDLLAKVLGEGAAAGGQADLAGGQGSMANGQADLAGEQADLAGSQADLAGSQADVASGRAHLAGGQADLPAGRAVNGEQADRTGHQVPRPTTGKEGNPMASSVIYACGPVPMLKKVAQLAGQYALPAQVSLEERMGCGLGACIGCAVGIQRPGQPFAYKKVCQDGPVFYAGEVVFP